MTFLFHFTGEKDIPRIGTKEDKTEETGEVSCRGGGINNNSDSAE